MSHGFEPGCKCSSCQRLSAIRLAEINDDEKHWKQSEPLPSSESLQPKVYDGYFDKPDDEPEKGRITQQQRPGGSVTYRFIRTK